MGYDVNGLFTIQIGSYIFLAQNYVRLESDPLRTWPFDNLRQILGPLASLAVPP